jgi:gluconolactonase
VFRPDASLIGTVTVPQVPANCSFGGSDRRTLYITARTALYQIHLNVPGKP